MRTTLCLVLMLVALGCAEGTGSSGGTMSLVSSEGDYVPELAMVDLVNRTRAEYKLPALNWNNSLARVAWGHSKDMFANRFFSHESPATGTMVDRVKRAGIRYRRVTENIHWASAPWTMEEHIRHAHVNLLNSPGHRKNILDRDVTDIGIGFYWKGRELFVTQLFARFPL
ncbi:MAG: CAP domain-containing protein [Deltaproteobacteria bacterium]|nr:CAP domain-containing protein [Deltaproteobacteria bacterium]